MTPDKGIDKEIDKGIEKRIYMRFINPDVEDPLIETARHNVGVYAEAYRNGIRDFRGHYDKSVESLRGLIRERANDYGFLELDGERNDVKRVNTEEEKFVKKIIPNKAFYTKGVDSTYIITPKTDDKKVAARLMAIADMILEKILEGELSKKEYAGLVMETYALAGVSLSVANHRKKPRRKEEDEKKDTERGLDPGNKRHWEKKLYAVKKMIGTRKYNRYNR